MENVEAEISDLKQTLNGLINDVEDLFYSFVAYRMSKKSIEEIVEHAVIEHFNIKRRDFHGTVFAKEGKRRNFHDESAAVKEARNWFVSIVRNFLHRSPYTLSVNVSFYQNKMEIRHRPIYNGALLPKTPDDFKNKETLTAIRQIIKRLCKEEGISSEDFDYL